ncbi:hypothetical protein ES703_80332 [subsurface metagenome]
MDVDLPFGAFEESREQAFVNAARAVAGTGCAPLKIEGGEDMGGNGSLPDGTSHSGDGSYWPYSAEPQFIRRLQGARARPRMCTRRELRAPAAESEGGLRAPQSRL